MDILYLKREDGTQFDNCAVCICEYYGSQVTYLFIGKQAVAEFVSDEYTVTLFSGWDKDLLSCTCTFKFLEEYADMLVISASDVTELILCEELAYMDVELDIKELIESFAESERLYF